MKHWPPPRRHPPDHRRVPAFSPVPLRTREDGWTPARQAAFLGALAETRSVTAAARKVRMARETAYRLRNAPGGRSFAAAWDAVMGRVTAVRRKVSHEERARRALEGLLKPIMHHGKHVATAEKADNSALLGHLAHLDRDQRRVREARGRSHGIAPVPAVQDRNRR